MRSNTSISRSGTSDWLSAIRDFSMTGFYRGFVGGLVIAAVLAWVFWE
jgi:hypothetical protein